MKASAFFAIICALAVLATSPLINSCADNNLTLKQAYIDEQELDLFIRGDLNPQSINVKIANKTARIRKWGTISKENVTVCTTFLLDISNSMPEPVRGKINEFLEYEIKNLTQYEEIKIVTFGDEIKMLQDFTSDRYDLSNATKVIDYLGTQSAIYDAIYNTIPKIQAQNREPRFYRTVLITDGVDYAAQGITKEELFMRLHSDTYPIDVICVSPEKPKNPNKDLSALSRISNGVYLDFYPESDIAKCVSEISSGDYFWVRSEVPADLLDGSTRQIEVSDGSDSLTFDMKLSTVKTPQEGSSHYPQSELDDPERSDTPSENENESDDQVKKTLLSTTDIIIIVSAGVIVIISVIVSLVVLNKKRHTVSTVQEIQRDNAKDESDATEFYNENDERQYYTVKLSTQDDPIGNWTLVIADETLIGRADNCKVRLNDNSVSREQCRISVRNAGLVLTNLSNANITRLNGIKVSGEQLLHSGDIIKLGRVSLRIDYIQKLGSEFPYYSHNYDDSDDGNTQSIF